jgi:hypothetical protein
MIKIFIKISCFNVGFATPTVIIHFYSDLRHYAETNRVAIHKFATLVALKRLHREKNKFIIFLQEKFLFLFSNVFLVIVLIKFSPGVP